MPTRANRFTLILVSALIIAASGCQRTPETLDVPFTPQGKVTLGVIRQGEARVDDEQPLVLVGERDEMRLSALYLVVADLEVHACPTTASLSPGDLLIAPARAHVPDSATRLGTPTLDDLLGPPNRARILGEVAPPPGTYCTVRVVLAAADEDVVNLTELAPEQIIGKSAIVEGEWRPRGGDAPWVAFRHAFTGPRVWHVTLPEPVVIDRHERGAFLLVERTLDGRVADAFGAWASTQVTAPTAAEMAGELLRLVGNTQRRYTSPGQHAVP